MGHVLNVAPTKMDVLIFLKGHMQNRNDLI